jgi:hypothetical protein
MHANTTFIRSELPLALSGSLPISIRRGQAPHGNEDLSKHRTKLEWKTRLLILFRETRNAN